MRLLETHVSHLEAAQPRLELQLASQTLAPRPIALPDLSDHNAILARECQGLQERLERIQNKVKARPETEAPVDGQRVDEL